MKKKIKKKKPNFTKVTKRIQSMKKNKVQQDKSVIPQCMNTIHDIVSRIDKADGTCFSTAPQYLKTELSNARSSLMSIFKNLGARLSNDNNKIEEATQVLASANPELAKAIGAIVGGDGDFLSPELVEENINTLRIIFDKSRVVINGEGINFSVDLEAEIEIDSVVKKIYIKGSFPVPMSQLIMV